MNCGKFVTMVLTVAYAITMRYNLNRKFFTLKYHHKSLALALRTSGGRHYGSRESK